VGNVHEFAEPARPDRRVVYVDYDESAVNYGRDLLSGVPGVAMALGDIRAPDALLALPEVGSLLDFTEPVAVLMLGVLHYVSDAERPRELVARYREVMAPGSYLVVSHGTDEAAPDHVRSMVDITEAGQASAYMRDRHEVAGFLAGLELVEPGVVFLPEWRPGPDDEPGSPNARVMAYAAVGRQP
jgi:O-methyltransferase involved in polyketide biosynthesis